MSDGELTPEQEALFDVFLQAADNNFPDAVEAYEDFEAQLLAHFEADTQATSEQAEIEAWFDANPSVAENWAEFTPFLERADGDADAALAEFTAASDAAHKLVGRAADAEGVGAPSSYDEAFAQSYREGLLGEKHEPAPPSTRPGLDGAVEDFSNHLKNESAQVAEMRKYLRGEGYEGAR